MVKRIPLTPKKQKWAANRDVTLNGTPLNYNAALQIRYERALLKLVNQMVAETKRAIATLAESETAERFTQQQEVAAAMDAPSITKRATSMLAKLTASFTKLFSIKAPELAEQMVDESDDTSARRLQTSVKELSGGLTLNTSIVPVGMEAVASALIEENVFLIKSIPQQYLKDISGTVMRSITSGNGLQDLTPHLAKISGVTKRRAELIALDQTRKAYNSLNKQRLQAIGVKQFKWLHSGGGQKPRASHIAMSGKVFSFDNPPQINKDNPGEPAEYGIPGQAPNCKCRMVPVLNFGGE